MSDPDSSPDHLEKQDVPEDESSLLSIEDLQKEIDKADPEFNNSLQELGAIKSSSLDASLDIEDTQPTLKGEKIKWEMTQGILYFLKKIFPFIIYLTFARNWLTYKGKRIFTDLRMRLTYGLSHIGPQLLETLKVKGPLLIQKTIQPFKAFNSLKSSEKMSLFGFLIFTIASISAMIWVLKADLLKEKADPFLLSMEEWSSEKYTYDSNENMESFYSSSRVSENVLSFPKIIANIKPSRSSESNPMIATEMFFEGFSPEVMLELKDREAEVKDVIINMASTMDYDTLTTIEGKQAMLEKLQQKINAILTQGQIRKIYLKNFIIKP